MPEAISEAELEQLLHGVPGVKQGGHKLVEPDWSTIANEHERKRKRCGKRTLQSTRTSAGIAVSVTCFRKWEGRLPLVMRQHHGGREKLFVDYVDDTLPAVGRKTGEMRDAHIFVAAMGASSLSFALAGVDRAARRLDRGIQRGLLSEKARAILRFLPDSIGRFPSLLL